MRTAVVCATLVYASALAQSVAVKDANASAVHGTTPKAGPSLYPASAAAFDGKAVVAAEFMGHTVNGERTSFAADDYVVIEVAIYPAKGETIDVHTSDFQLRIGEKRVEIPQTPQAVAASMKYPDWSSAKTAQIDVGINDSDVRIGRPAPVGRFPGDPNTRNRYPRKPPVQTKDESAVQPQDGPEAAVYSALVEGPTTAPVSGLLYFEYKGKLKNLKVLDLLIRSSSDTPQALPLRTH